MIVCRVAGIHKTSSLEEVFKKMCSIEIVPLSVRPSGPYFFAISAPRELKILIYAQDYVSPRSTAEIFDPWPGSSVIES
jgi:hypothetical protein